MGAALCVELTYLPLAITSLLPTLGAVGSTVAAVSKSRCITYSNCAIAAGQVDTAESGPVRTTVAYLRDIAEALYKARIRATFLLANQSFKKLLNWKKYSGKPPVPSRAEISSWFNKLDRDGGGTISFDELSFALPEMMLRKGMMPYYTFSQLQEVYVIADEDMSGELDREEFIELVEDFWDESTELAQNFEEAHKGVTTKAATKPLKNALDKAREQDSLVAA